MVDARNQLTCPIILRQTISHAIMWKSRRVAEPEITLNKHKTSSPLGVSAVYSSSEKMGSLSAQGPILTESQAQIPLGCVLSDHTWLSHSSRLGNSLLCSRAHCWVDRQVDGGKWTHSRTTLCNVGWAVSMQAAWGGLMRGCRVATYTDFVGGWDCVHRFQHSWLLGWG